MVVQKSRTGRLQQRYEEVSVNNPISSSCSELTSCTTSRKRRRLLSCAVVVEQAQVLLITSATDPSKWILPKGGWENDETLEECVLRETIEEAGVEADSDPQQITPLGRTDYVSQKGNLCGIYGFKLRCKKMHEEWHENDRQRKWVPYEEAKELLRNRTELLEVLNKAFKKE